MILVADHLLHVTLTSEGYWTYRLECLPAVGQHDCYTAKANGCDCVCVMCSGDDPDHAGCEVHGGEYIELVGYRCQTEAEDGCWVHDWLDEVGGECIHGNDWPEDGAPFAVWCDYDEGLVIKFVSDAVVQPRSAAFVPDTGLPLVSSTPVAEMAERAATS